MVAVDSAARRGAVSIRDFSRAPRSPLLSCVSGVARFWDIVGSLTGAMPPPQRPGAPRRHVPIVGEDGTVIGDFPCHGCGYDLRTLNANDRCPECGTLVRASVRGNVLKYSDPVWLRRVATGVRRMGKSGLIATASAVAWVFTSVSALAPLATFALVLAVAAFLWGAWDATTPDPSGIDERRCAKLSTLARSLLLAGLFAAPATTLRARIPLPDGLIRSTTALLLAAGFAGILATVRLFQRLTLRIPDGRLFAALETYFRVLLIAVSAATASVWIMNLIEPPPARFATPLACVLLFPLLIVVIATLNFFSICSDLADHLNEQAATAAKLWPEA